MLIFLQVLLLCTLCFHVSAHQQAPARAVVSSAASVTSASISALSIDPALVACPLGCDTYLSASSALSQFGPISAYGPLGMLGPIGDNSWQPSAWISGFGDWSKFSSQVTGLKGPLSAAGPLGNNGPLGKTAYYSTLPALNDFGKHLQAGGVFGVLGPAGPLGAVGPLGPLGPIGGHGFKADSNGQYLNQKGQVQRSIKVGARTFQLFEAYTENWAKSIPDNDCSFMVYGDISSASETDSYKFNCVGSQYVTVTLVPEHQLDIFNLHVTAPFSASSASDTYVNWIQFSLPASSAIHVRVGLTSSMQYLLKRAYRLIVVGSTSLVDPKLADFNGKYLKSYPYTPISFSTPPKASKKPKAPAKATLQPTSTPIKTKPKRK